MKKLYALCLLTLVCCRRYPLLSRFASCGTNAESYWQVNNSASEVLQEWGQAWAIDCGH